MSGGGGITSDSCFSKRPMVRGRYAIQSEPGLYSVQITRVLIGRIGYTYKHEILASNHLKTVNEADDVIFCHLHQRQGGYHTQQYAWK